eukprot:TRINITY_DN67523_c0_g1_i1.p1 TRINITY_DN67523_c0_g1~~TRINITY_DN67523_c0_g1_i1.p1  ORF type:complete len:717 (-),score=59.28 TRINITY_DN67523_c0_g1_i1:239-2389(-)
MPREQTRRKEARQARFETKAGATPRRPPTKEEVRALIWAIHKNDMKGFGIRQLAPLDVNYAVPVPRWITWVDTMTFLDIACYEDRDGHVAALMNAGADPSLGFLPPGALDTLPRPYAAWVAKAAAEMRRHKAIRCASTLPALESHENRSGISGCEMLTCACVAEASMVFSPCGHPCCEKCVWDCFTASDLSPSGEDGGCGEAPEFTCPHCGTACRLGGFSSEVPTETSVTKQRLLQAQARDSVGQCFSGCMMWLSGSRSRSQRNARERGKASRARWAALPNVMPQTIEDWSKLRDVAQSCQSGRQKRTAWLRAQGADGPGVDSDTKPKGRVKSTRFKALSLEECIGTHLGMTQTQRSEQVRRAIERGQARRLQALLEAGANLGDTNEYGHTPLFVAAWRGRASIVEILLHWAADPNVTANGGPTPLSAAAACGHHAVVQLLQNAGGSARLSPKQQISASVPLGRITPVAVSTTCAGSRRACYMDGIFTEEFLCRLERLWKTLPVAAKETEYDGLSQSARKLLLSKGASRADRSQQGSAPRRSYFCDAEGWILQEIQTVLCQELHCETTWSYPWSPQETSKGRASAPCQFGYSQMRFLNYAKEGGFLAPHTDLSRTDFVTGKRSTHTFILYLSGNVEEPEKALCLHEQENTIPRNVAGSNGAGGETVLLEKLDGDSSSVLAVVTPVRGRLFMFPHDCPHKAMPVLMPPKLILRGEMR